MSEGSGHRSEQPRPTGGSEATENPATRYERPASSEALQRTDHTPNEPGEETIDAPVLEGAEELRQEAQEAVESGDVDLSDTTYGGPSVVDKPVVTE